VAQEDARRLRVAFVVPYFPLDRFEKGYPHVMDAIEWLGTRCDLEVVALRDATAHGPYRMAGTRARRLGLRNARGPHGRVRVLLTGIREVWRIHRRGPVDLVHGWAIDEPGAVAAIAARLIGRPCISSVIGGELVAFPDLWYGAALARGGRLTNAITLRLATAITVGSLAMKAMVDATRRDAHLRPLGVDLDRFHPPADGARSGAPRRVLFANSLEPIKVPSLAIRTFARLCPDRADLHMDIYGDGSLRSSLEELCVSLKVRERVTFHGHLPHRDMPAAYGGASVFLLTSRFESQSVVALEAAASGVPIVSTRVGLLPELGEAAIVVDTDSDADLAVAVARVLDDPALAARMAATGRAVATERFGFDQNVTALLDLYRSLAR
jgi:glycosyltransferase involved in cell wall biosynthesis